MPDEIGWLDPSDEADLDLARRTADLESPATDAEQAEVDRRCKAAEAYRQSRSRSRAGKKSTDETQSGD